MPPGDGHHALQMLPYIPHHLARLCVAVAWRCAESSFPRLLTTENVKVMTKDGRGTESIRNPLTYYCFRVSAALKLNFMAPSVTISVTQGIWLPRLSKVLHVSIFAAVAEHSAQGNLL
jgi:hypothetical protein